MGENHSESTDDSAARDAYFASLSGEPDIPESKIATEPVKTTIQNILTPVSEPVELTDCTAHTEINAADIRSLGLQRNVLPLIAASFSAGGGQSEHWEAWLEKQLSNGQAGRILLDDDNVLLAAGSCQRTSVQQFSITHLTNLSDDPRYDNVLVRHLLATVAQPQALRAVEIAARPGEAEYERLQQSGFSFSRITEEHFGRLGEAWIYQRDLQDSDFDTARTIRHVWLESATIPLAGLQQRK